MAGRRALLVVDVQPCFAPPAWQVEGVALLAPTMLSVATVERHDEAVTPFRRQTGWAPAPDDAPLVATDQRFVKHGYPPPPALVTFLREEGGRRCWCAGYRPTPAVWPRDSCCSTQGCTRPCSRG